MAPRPAHSLRGRLLALLAGLVIVGSALQVATTFRAAISEADDLFDYHMRQIALSLRDAGYATVGASAFGAPADFDFVVQVWSAQGVRVYQSHRHVWLPQEAVLGFSVVQAPDGEWRTFAVSTGDRVIQVAQSVAVRRDLALRYATRSAWPVLGLAVVLLAGVWWVVTSSLAPITRARREIARRDARSLSPIDAEGLPSEVVPLVAELNALLARLRDALLARQRFVADAAHELRTPVAALKLQLQVLERARDDASRAQAFERLRAGVERATRLVEQLMALEREQASEAPATQTPSPAPRDTVVLAASARDALACCAELAAARGIALSIDADETVHVCADAVRLDALLRNLVDNAVRYTPDGGRVHLTVVRDGSHALALVDDTGPGIPPEDRERVFDRFYRRPGARGNGSGLGLAIARTAAEALHGSVTLGVSPLGGLRASVRLPASP